MKAGHDDHPWLLEPLGKKALSDFLIDYTDNT